MQINPHLVMDLVTTGPAVVTQVVLAIVLLRWTNRRYRWALPLVSAGVCVFFAAFAIAILSGYSRFHRIVVITWRFLPDVWWQYVGFMRAVVFLWGFSSTVALLIYLFCFRLLPRCSFKFDPARRKALHTAGSAAMLAPFGFAAVGTGIVRTDFRVSEVDVPIPGLPADLQGLRILQLSDIHLSAFLSEKELERVIDASNGLRAHIALITGDLISTAGDPLDACLRQLARLRTDSGSIGCLGNHEIYAKAEAYTAREGARLGIPFLRGQNRQLRFGNALLNIAGVDYQPFDKRPTYLAGAEKLVVPGVNNLLMSHNPDVFPVAVKQGYDLTMAGHTHGGQVTVEILNQSINPARIFTPFVSGLYRSGNASCYVTRGIGTIGIPMRLGATPEITLLRLQKA